MQCKRQRKLFPQKRYILLHLIPGAVLAFTGMAIFAFLETEENYKYTHSCWHVAMSLSVVFLLPGLQKKGINITDSSSNNLTNNNSASNSRIVLSSYADMPNGHSESVEISMGDNPAYSSPD